MKIFRKKKHKPKEQEIKNQKPTETKELPEGKFLCSEFKSKRCKGESVGCPHRHQHKCIGDTCLLPGVCSMLSNLDSTKSPCVRVDDESNSGII